jgi:hypothetical protein
LIPFFALHCTSKTSENLAAWKPSSTSIATIWIEATATSYHWYYKGSITDCFATTICMKVLRNILCLNQSLLLPLPNPLIVLHWLWIKILMPGVECPPSLILDSLYGTLSSTLPLTHFLSTMPSAQSLLLFSPISQYSSTDNDYSLPYLTTIQIIRTFSFFNLSEI